MRKVNGLVGVALPGLPSLVIEDVVSEGEAIGFDDLDLELRRERAARARVQRQLSRERPVLSRKPGCARRRSELVDLVSR
ncbi:hypothetical protein GCM10009664_21260 [Kitasatospora gansuensis]